MKKTVRKPMGIVPDPYNDYNFFCDILSGVEVDRLKYWIVFKTMYCDEAEGWHVKMTSGPYLYQFKSAFNKPILVKVLLCRAI
jgi:hypothetical protein